MKVKAPQRIIQEEIKSQSIKGMNYVRNRGIENLEVSPIEEGSDTDILIRSMEHENLAMRPNS
jgi:hypothetical protein